MRGHVLPVLQVILLPVCCTATYLWSVLLGHVEAGFPYISDTGTYPPESCLFGLLLAIYSGTTALIVHSRWQQVRTYYCNSQSRAFRYVNNTSLVCGLAASFGVLLVANFQETNVVEVHMIGAALAFGVGTIYTWLQSYLSFKGHHLPGHRKCLRHFRLVLSVVITFCCVLVVIFATIANNKLGKVDKSDGHFKWSHNDKGFSEHVASTALEWVMALLSAVFFASFASEFRHFTVTMPIEFTAISTQVKDVAVANGNWDSGDMNGKREQESSSVFTVPIVSDGD